MASGKTEMKTLLGRIEKAGYDVRQSKRNSHWKVFDPAGHLLAVTSSTSGDFRAMRNFRHGLTRADILAADGSVNPASPRG